MDEDKRMIFIPSSIEDISYKRNNYFFSDKKAGLLVLAIMGYALLALVILPALKNVLGITLYVIFILATGQYYVRKVIFEENKWIDIYTKYTENKVSSIGAIWNIYEFDDKSMKYMNQNKGLVVNLKMGSIIAKSDKFIDRHLEAKENFYKSLLKDKLQFVVLDVEKKAEIPESIKYLESLLAKEVNKNLRDILRIEINHMKKSLNSRTDKEYFYVLIYTNNPSQYSKLLNVELYLKRLVNSSAYCDYGILDKKGFLDLSQQLNGIKYIDFDKLVSQAGLSLKIEPFEVVKKLDIDGYEIIDFDEFLDEEIEDKDEDKDSKEIDEKLDSKSKESEDIEQDSKNNQEDQVVDNDEDSNLVDEEESDKDIIETKKEKKERIKRERKEKIEKAEREKKEKVEKAKRDKEEKIEREKQEKLRAKEEKEKVKVEKKKAKKVKVDKEKPSKENAVKEKADKIKEDKEKLKQEKVKIENREKEVKTNKKSSWFSTNKKESLVASRDNIVANEEEVKNRINNIVIKEPKLIKETKTIEDIKDEKSINNIKPEHEIEQLEVKVNQVDKGLSVVKAEITSRNEKSSKDTQTIKQNQGLMVEKSAKKIESIKSTEVNGSTLEEFKESMDRTRIIKKVANLDKEVKIDKVERTLDGTELPTGFNYRKVGEK